MYHCVYCQQKINKARRTRDDIFATCLIGDKRPFQNIQKVPGCGKCQSEYSKYEENLRNYLALKIRLGGLRAVRMRDAAMRSFNYTYGNVKRNNLKRKLKFIQSVTKSGTKLNYEIDIEIPETIEALAKKWVKGLIYLKVKQILSPDAPLITKWTDKGSVADWLYMLAHNKMPETFFNIGGVGIIAYHYVAGFKNELYPKIWWFLLGGFLKIKTEIKN